MSTPKVGALDDPIWAEPLPTIPGGPFRHRHRIWRRNGVMILVLGLLVAGAVVFWAARGADHPGGDPGGLIMHSLRAGADSILPVGAQVTRAQYVEPRWDSCDGMAGTFGWDPVEVDVIFDSDQPGSVVISHANMALTASGWVSVGPVRNSGHFTMTWIKAVENGSRARLQLTNSDSSLPTDGWDLSGDAPAEGRAVSGC